MYHIADTNGKFTTHAMKHSKTAQILAWAHARDNFRGVVVHVTHDPILNMWHKQYIATIKDGVVTDITGQLWDDKLD